MSKHRVVIIGGGFGGLYAARALKSAPVDVTVLDRRNFHLFQPLLYQVATGSLSPGEIAAPIRAVLSKQKNTRVLLGEASGIDPAGRRIFLRDGAELEYDTLIVATGSRSSYFGHDGWREWAPSLKTVEEATAIRHKILYAFEAAERTLDQEERRAWLTFLIVGAGPTGVELSGAVAEIARHTLKHDFRLIRPEESQILLLDGSPRVLQTYPEDLSRKAEKFLVRLGVRVRNGVRVVGVDGEGVTIQTEKGSQRIQSKTVLWAAGVAPSEFAGELARRTNSATDETGRLEVNGDLTLPNYPDIFVVGDMARVKDGKGNPLPGMVQVAMQGGAFAAHTIADRAAGRQPPPVFRYFDKGSIAVIGRACAVADIFGFHVSGLPAWLIWIFVHLMYIVEFQSRILVFIQWGFQYLSFSRGARLITGTAATDSITAPEIMKNSA